MCAKEIHRILVNKVDIIANINFLEDEHKWPPDTNDTYLNQTNAKQKPI